MRLFPVVVPFVALSSLLLLLLASNVSSSSSSAENRQLQSTQQPQFNDPLSEANNTNVSDAENFGGDSNFEQVGPDDGEFVGSNEDNIFSNEGTSNIDNVMGNVDDNVTHSQQGILNNETNVTVDEEVSNSTIEEVVSQISPVGSVSLEEDIAGSTTETSCVDFNNGGLLGSNLHSSVGNSSICPLVSILPFTISGKDITYYGPSLSNDRAPNSQAFTHMAAAALAVKHFNDRDPRVVPELADPVYKNCSAFIPTELELLRFADSKMNFGGTDFLLEQNSRGKPICAIVGPYLNQPTLEAASIGRSLNVPVLSHGANENDLKWDTSPTVVMTSVNLHPMGEAVVSWLRSIGRTNYLAVVYASAGFGVDYDEAIDNAAKESNFTHVLHMKFGPPFTGYEPNRGMWYALQEIKKSTYKTIFVVVYEYFEILYVADAAEEFQMNNGDYVWGISGNIDFQYLARMASENKNVSKLVNGMASVRLLDGFDYHPALNKTDPLLDTWREQDGEFVNYVNQLNPIPPDAPGYFYAEQDYFQTYLPGHGAGYMYDAVMAVGLGKCQHEYSEALAQAAENAKYDDEIEEMTGNRAESIEASPQGEDDNVSSEHKDGGNGSRRRTKVKGEVKSSLAEKNKEESQKYSRKLQKKKKKSAPLDPFVESIIKNTFTGATGRLEWMESRRFVRSRRRDSLLYGVYNFKIVNSTEQEAMHDFILDEDLTHWFHLTSVLQGHPVTGTWEETKNGPFYFANGSTTPPILLRDIPEQNYVSNKLRIMGFVLMSVTLTMVLISVWFVFQYRENTHVKGAQPTFLYILLFSVSVLAWSIFPISFDESNGWDEKRLSIACMIYPWLVSLGYIGIYLALFCKLWRINKVLQFRRRRVRIRDVLAPLVGVGGITVIVLIIWTAHDPFVWEREEIDSWTGESYGKCNSDNATHYFAPLLLIYAFSTIVAGYMAWETKDVDPKYSDSKWIFYTIFVHMQVLCVGLPILIILDNSSADASYLGRVLLTNAITISTVILMVIPKAVKVLVKQNDTRSRGSHSGIAVTGVNIKVPNEYEFTSTCMTSETPGDRLNQIELRDTSVSGRRDESQSSHK